MKPPVKAWPTFTIGDRVLITRGLAAGKRGFVLEKWPRGFGGIPMWVIGSDDLVRRRVLRADHLQLETVS